MARQEVLIASAQFTAQTTVAIDVHRYEAIKLTVDCTSINAVTPSVEFELYYLDVASGDAITVLKSAAVVATGKTYLSVGPGLAVVANVSANEYLPADLLLRTVHGDVDAINFSVGVQKMGHRPTR